MIGWDYWQTLLAVFRGGNYAQAAKVLNIDPTTVGRRVKMLERHMGCTLFLRDEGRLYPTSQCESLLTHLEEAFESLRHAENKSEVGDHGIMWRLVRITAPPFLINNIYSPAIPQLHETRRMQLELIGTGNNLNLTRREADIAIRIQDHPSSTTFDTHSVMAEKIGEIEFAVYQRKDRGTEALAWAGLTDSHISTTGTRAMHKLVGKQGLQYRVSHFDALENILCSGAARGLIPCFMADHNHRLTRQGAVILKQPLWMLFHRQDKDTLHQKAAREWIIEQTIQRLG